MPKGVDGAFVAWYSAVRNFIGKEFPSESSIEDVASQYGRNITNDEDFKKVELWFNWDEITKFLESSDNHIKGERNEV